MIDIDEKSFRLNCRGGKLSTVREALKEKIIENWAVFDATISARSKAEGDILKIIRQKEISDFYTSR